MRACITLSYERVVSAEEDESMDFETVLAFAVHPIPERRLWKNLLK